jgi:glucose-6-phosphate dehydrogenase assembly protein OpcA
MKGVGMATDNSATQGIQIPWAGKQVRQEHVEDELTKLWHLAADNMRISQNMNVRTSVLNFVICAPDVDSAYKASALLRDLASTNIARVTLLILDSRRDSPADVSTWVTLRSFPIISDIMRHHFEQVTVSVTGAAVQYAANVVQALLKPDLPAYLWWLEDLPAQGEIFSRLVSISSRVLFDSNYFSQPEAQIRFISDLIQRSQNYALSDLAWGRITAWRELIAQFFDIPEYRPYLMSVDTIQIEHTINAPDSSATTTTDISHPLGALLLAAWLKTRLGWQLSPNKDDNYQDKQTGTYDWHMTTRDMTRVASQPLSLDTKQAKGASAPLHGIHISIRPFARADSEAGMLCLIRLHCSLEGNQATFTITRGDDDDHVQTAVEMPGNVLPQRTVNIAATHKASNLLHNELEIMGRDYLYEETVHEAIALLN